jgi:chromosome segregation protein
MQGLSSSVEDLNSRISDIKGDLGQEEDALGGINARMENLEKQKLTLESHRQFIEKLKTKYEDISESMNAVVYLDKLPAERVTGLVVKINGFEEGGLKLSGEAKPMDLDTQKIIERLQGIQEERASLEENKKNKEARIEEFNQLMMNLQQQLRNHDIALANAKTNYQAILEQFNKIKEEEEVIGLELSDVEKEIAALEQKLGQARTAQSDLENMQGQVEQIIASEQNSVASNSELKEKVLVAVAQLKTELDGLAKRVYSEDATLKILGETYQRDKESLLNIENQIRETGNKKESLALGIRDSETKITELSRLIESQKLLLRQREDEHLEWINCATDLMANIESDRGHLDALKNKLHDLQMRNKDIDFKFLSIKERILQNYKLDIETLLEPRPGLDENALKQEIQRLKEKIDSYGSVNLVAIEEYDELKKRYDFLVQQQNDLAFAKESLHEAILKINRTTRKMFLETFELVRQEFRNYFRLLFNGGDAQVFLIDEQDVLESGIEIICRPPGKKLQNVLLLSGGEKALSAIALIFAVFKVKPSPFCILDEIDAALDEANVDRYSRTLQEFAKNSQFIVITHNKRTIINADIMYGITMEESGISKIVSVKFSQDRPAPKEEAIGVA